MIIIFTVNEPYTVYTTTSISQFSCYIYTYLIGSDTVEYISVVLGSKGAL